MITRTINSVRNPQWANRDKTLVNLEVDFDELDEEYVQFTADPNDTMAYGVDLYNRAIAGEFGEIADWTPPDNFTAEQSMEALRAQRTFLLAETDYIEMPTKWATLTAEQQTAWATYRNALRDLPETYPDVRLEYNSDYSDLIWVNVTWPTKPE